MSSKILKFIFCLFIINLSCGCAITQNADRMFKNDESVIEQRNLQTHIFEAANKRIFFESVISALQDMGYIITETNMNSDILTAYKRARLSEREAFKLLTKTLFLAPLYYDVTLSLTLQPSAEDEKKFIARAMFSQQIWAIQPPQLGGQIVKVSSKTLKDTVYNDFFAIIEQSLFIENQTL